MLSFRQTCIYLATVCLLLAYRLPAQNVSLGIDKRLSQYVMKSWSTDAGMTSESTNEIMQTEDGYIWIATYAGLHRFDGKDFTIYNSLNSNIPSPNVLCIEKGLDGKIWIGSLHGIAIFDNGDFVTPEPLSSIKDYSIEEMLITKNGDLWFSTKSNHLYLFKNDILKEFTEEFGLTESTVLSMIESDSGDVLFGTDDSKLLHYSKEGKFNEISMTKQVNGINTFFTHKGLIYIGTGRGMYVWDGEEVISHSLISNQSITKLHIDQNEVMWFGTMNGLFRWDPTNSRMDSLTEATGMPNNIVRDMIFDRDGNLWVATYRDGIFFLYDGSIVSYTKSDGVETNIVASVTEIGDNRYLLGNENTSLNLLDNGEISKWIPPIPLPNARLKNLFTDSKDRVWVSTYSGLYVLDGSNSRRFTVNDGFPDNYVRIANEDVEGNVWVGTKNAGLFRFSSLNKWEQISIEDGLSSNYIMSIDTNNKGQLIVGTISGLNIINKDGTIKQVTVDDGLPSNFMFATYSTQDFIWIASNDGLTGYSENKIVNYNSENGFPVDIIYDILEDEEGNFWMPSEHSILSLNISSLEASIDNPSTDLNVKVYDKSYGMKNSNCLGAVHSFQDSNGRLWIPTLEGIVNLDPTSIKPQTFASQLIIEGIFTDNNRLETENISLQPGTGRLLIDFTSIDFKHTDQVSIRYKLDPFDEQWIKASPERDAIYTNLSPGSYNFILQAGIDENYEGIQLTKVIVMEASWWQTIWARIVIVLLIIALALFIYWLRLRTLTRRNLRLEETVTRRTSELEKQKEELNVAIIQLKKAQEQMVQSDKMASLGILSAGVAHEINNPLNFIQGGVEGLEYTLEKNKSIDKEEYTKMLEAIKEGISRASKIVSSLNEFSHSRDEQDEPCNIHHMIENCLTMIQYRLKDGIELIRDFTTEDVMVMGNNGKIHQAFLNIVTNAIQAIDDKGTITIKTRIENQKIVIEFIDSGQGIKPEHMSKITEPFFSTKDPGKGTGLGLSITYSIIADHKGELKYSSVWGEGTTAKITLPKI